MDENKDCMNTSLIDLRFKFAVCLKKTTTSHYPALVLLLRGPVPGPHYHRGLAQGPGGARALPAAPPHLGVQRGPLHHLL